jgi:hypothetical protein
VQGQSIVHGDIHDRNAERARVQWPDGQRLRDHRADQDVDPTFRVRRFHLIDQAPRVAARIGLVAIPVVDPRRPYSPDRSENRVRSELPERLEKAGVLLLEVGAHDEDAEGRRTSALGATGVRRRGDQPPYAVRRHPAGSRRTAAVTCPPCASRDSA